MSRTSHRTKFTTTCSSCEKLKMIYTAAGLKFPLTLNSEFQQRLAKLKSESCGKF